MLMYFPPRCAKLTKQLLLIATVLPLFLVSTEFATAQVWNQLAPTGGPPTGRFAASSVFDSATNQMIIFGGVSSAPAVPSNVDFNDVWSLKAGASPQWTQLSPSGSAPQARAGHTAVYDSANSRMTIFGGGLGFSSPCSNDTWVLSDANSVAGSPAWTQLSPSGGPPAPRIFHTAVRDPGSNRMIVFGGNDCFSAGAYYNDVWVLTNANGLGGNPVWIQLAPTGQTPPGRAYHGAFYDPVSNRMTIFGGTPGMYAELNDVWVLSNANGLGGTPTWTQLTPSGTPPSPRLGFATADDPASNLMIVFGGANGGGNLNETWVLSDANGLGSPAWTLLDPSGTPPGVRNESTAVFDPSLNGIVVFGGVSGSPTAYYSDTWALAPVTPTVASPVFAPPGGIYTSIQTVTITDGTPDATIYYTTNGSIPTTSSEVYSGPLTVSTTGTVKAIAVATGYANSAVVSATYNLVVATPVFAPLGGTYNSVQTVAITDATPGAVIHYTSNGSMPTVASTQYTGPITVSTSETVKAMAAAPGFTNSLLATAAYTLRAAIPVFTPGGGAYNSIQTVSITDATPGAAIYYTIDGTTPTTASNHYTAPFTLSATTTVKAIAVAAGFQNSSVAGAIYTIHSIAATPTFSPAPGTYGLAQLVTLASATPGATIYYTTDGTAPTTSSAQYSNPILVSASLNLRAFAAVAGYANSNLASGFYGLIGTPEVLTGIANNVATPDATLNATANNFGVAGQARFVWGISKTNLASTTPATALPALSGVQNVSTVLTGLTSGTTYYFQPVVSTVGGTSYGAIQSFTTN